MSKDHSVSVTHSAVPRAQKRSESVAMAIVSNIVAEHLKPGDRLPSEAVMLETYQVSRSSLREALRLLEVQGLIVIKPGRGKGPLVGKATVNGLASTFTLYLQMMGATYNQLLEAWVSIEPFMARLAAEHPDRQRVTEALGPFTGADDDDCSIDAGFAFHDAVNSLSDNPVLHLILTLVSTTIAEYVMENIAGRDRLEDHNVQEHRDIAKAIIEGDGAFASGLMKRHIQAVVEDFRAYWPAKVGDIVAWK